MGVKCPKCGWDNRDNAAACANCFQDLRSGRAGAPQQPTQAQHPEQTQHIPAQPPPPQPYQPQSPYGQQQQAPPQQHPGQQYGGQQYPGQPYQQPYPGAQYPQAVGYAYAGFWIRVGAALIDGLVLFVGGLAIGATPLAVLSVALGPVYFVGMNSAYGATLGKMALGLMILKSDGSSITFGTALVRYILKTIFTIVTCGLAYIAVAVDERHQGWHDKIGDTIVIHTR